MARARNEFTVTLDGDETWLQAKLLNKLSQRQAIGDRLRFSVDRDVQGEHF